MSGTGLNMSRRIRRTPYTERVEDSGARGFTVVNHMLLPKAFDWSLEEDYWHLREHVQVWDVACQRQVEIRGKDASRLVQLMTPRDLRQLASGRGIYVPLIDENAGMLNDPVLLKLDHNHFWLSIADSDVLLWAKGLAVGMGLNVVIDEPDVSPLAIQGPKANQLMEDIFGGGIRNLKHFDFDFFNVLGTKQLIAKSGYSKQGGFEIYLNGSCFGSALWDLIWKFGEKYNIRPGSPNLIERIEGGLLSYGNEFTRANNPFECGFGSQCYLGDDLEYVGSKALREISKKGFSRLIVGVKFGTEPSLPCAIPFLVTSVGGETLGQITSAAFSPRLRCNVGLAILPLSHCEAESKVVVFTTDGKRHEGCVSPLPFG